jgi:hypothetical protein
MQRREQESRRAEYSRRSLSFRGGEVIDRGKREPRLHRIDIEPLLLRSQLTDRYRLQEFALISHGTGDPEFHSVYARFQSINAIAQVFESKWFLTHRVVDLTP